VSNTASLRTGEELERFAREVCAAFGTDPEIAAVVASHLSRSNLSGHDSHGVLRLPWYREQAGSGELKPSARAEVISEVGSIAVIDAHYGFGHHTSAFAMNWAISAAERLGVGIAAIRHSNHIGRVGEYVETAAARGLIGIATVGVVGAGGVAPFGARGRFLGTNPWAFGVPAGDRPAVFDGATSAVAEGKVRVALAKGAELPPGAIVDSDGNPSVQPPDLYDGGALLPLGGDLAGHKGYGYAVASALLGGLGMIGDLHPTAAGTASVGYEPGLLGGVLVMAINPAAFGDAAAYEAQTSAVMERLREQAPAPGRTEVLVPGDPERRARRVRSESGVEIPTATLEALDELAAELGVRPL